MGMGAHTYVARVYTACVCEFTHVHTCVHVCMYTCSQMHKSMHMRIVRPHVDKCIHTSVHCTCMHICEGMSVHVNTHIRDTCICMCVGAQHACECTCPWTKALGQEFHLSTSD